MGPRIQPEHWLFSQFTEHTHTHRHTNKNGGKKKCCLWQSIRSFILFDYWYYLLSSLSLAPVIIPLPLSSFSLIISFYLFNFRISCYYALHTIKLDRNLWLGLNLTKLNLTNTTIDSPHALVWYHGTYVLDAFLTSFHRRHRCRFLFVTLTFEPRLGDSFCFLFVFSHFCSVFFFFSFLLGFICFIRFSVLQ